MSWEGECAPIARSASPEGRRASGAAPNRPPPPLPRFHTASLHRVGGEAGAILSIPLPAQHSCHARACTDVPHSDVPICACDAATSALGRVHSSSRAGIHDTCLHHPGLPLAVSNDGMTPAGQHRTGMHCGCRGNMCKEAGLCAQSKGRPCSCRRPAAAAYRCKQPWQSTCGRVMAEAQPGAAPVHCMRNITR